jgi:hypothetical protein
VVSVPGAARCVRRSFETYVFKTEMQPRGKDEASDYQSGVRENG